MKITDRFIGDHKTFRKLMGDLDILAVADTPDQKRLIRLIELFVDHLILHSWGEETFYYPAVAAKAGQPPLTQAYMTLLDEDHAVVDKVIQRLETEVKRQPLNPIWKASYAEFKKGLTDHMRKEEDELFPLSEKLLGATELQEISATLEKRRSEAPKIRIHSSF